MKDNSYKDGRGGAREGAGRKSIVDELSKKVLIQRAVNTFYKKDNDNDANIALIDDLLGFERGQMFVAEHLFGKPKESLDVTSGNAPIQNLNLGKLTDQELSIILKLHAGQPINTDGEPN